VDDAQPVEELDGLAQLESNFLTPPLAKPSVLCPSEVVDQVPALEVLHDYKLCIVSIINFEQFADIIVAPHQFQSLQLVAQLVFLGRRQLDGLHDFDSDGHFGALVLRFH